MSLIPSSFIEKSWREAIGGLGSFILGSVQQPSAFLVRMSYRSNLLTLKIAAVAACLFAVPAWAAVPTKIASVIHADAPYGAGKYTFLLTTAYDAELWTDAPQWSMDEPFALTLRYHVGFSTEDIVSRSEKEMKHVDPSLSDAALKSYGEDMTKAFPPVKNGDEITALYVPGKPVRFFLNGAATGEIADATFATDFFGIWLSPRSSDRELRRALLKLK